MIVPALSYTTGPAAGGAPIFFRSLSLMFLQKKPMTKHTMHSKSPIMKRMLQVNPDAEPESILRPHMTHCARALAGARKRASQHREMR